MYLVDWYCVGSGKFSAAVASPDAMFSLCSVLEKSDAVAVFSFSEDYYCIAPWAVHPQRTFHKFIPVQMWGEMKVFGDDILTIKRNLSAYKKSMFDSIRRQREEGLHAPG